MGRDESMSGIGKKFDRKIPFFIFAVQRDNFGGDTQKEFWFPRGANICNCLRCTPHPSSSKKKKCFPSSKGQRRFSADRQIRRKTQRDPADSARQHKKKKKHFRNIYFPSICFGRWFWSNGVVVVGEGKNRMARMKIFFFYGDITIWMETWVCAVHSDNHFSSFFSKSSSCNGNSLSSRVLSMCSLNCARARSRKEGASTGGSSQRRVTGHIRWWTCHSVLVLQGGAALASLGISSWKSFFLFLLF